MIYIIEADLGSFKRYKVGFTKENPEFRMRQIQTSCPVPLKLVQQFPGDRQLEQKLHGYLNNIHYAGEWFHDGPLIQEIIKKGWFGKRDTIENGYDRHYVAVPVPMRKSLSRYVKK